MVAMVINPNQALINRVSALIEERTGIAVHTKLRDMLIDLLSSEDSEKILEQLKHSRETDPLWQKFIRSLTIGETYFLRDRPHFQLMRKQILPELIQNRRQKDMLTLNIWSVGCATGEEPYSLAITLYEMLPDITRWNIQLIGTDLNGDALRVARRGVYRKWAFRHTDLDFQGTYFDPTNEGLKIKSHIQNLVQFRHANVFYGPPLPQFDLILCRNMLLYLNIDHASRAEMIFHNALTPGGWLLLGHSETLHSQKEQWLVHLHAGLPVFRKPQQTTNGYPRTVPGKRTTQTVNTIQLSNYEDAVLALQDENYTAAETLLRQLLAFEPNHASAHVLKAYIQANRNQLIEAHKSIDLALRIDPLLADAHYLKAALYIEEERTQEAADALRAALYCQRNHPLASFMLGNMHAQAGEITKANRYWENAKRATASLRPDSPVSDISDISAGQLNALIDEQLQGWQT